MKLNPKNIEILTPDQFKMVASDKMTVTSKSVTVSASLVKQMGYPEYVRLYLDRIEKQLFIVSCERETEGARKFYKSSAKSKTALFASAKLAKVLAEVGGFEITKGKARFDAESVEGRENALGFDLSKPK
ncbi:hypothetical protein [Enterococcus sp. BWR-S5]|uniref:hypothetical protein n=1 Tax=Enterococcus sp. BWR-S5 TaxID=2787714 RepID=UPI0019236FFD|nr:hypothetical protein [Enterococcus sp. BWR-S5]MBL1226594.1 hypothetical protein [Enterococcus sp. BWR-S5]